MRFHPLVVRFIAFALVLAVTLPVVSSLPAAAQVDQRFYPDTGFRIDNDAVWAFFSQHGGTRAFGSPVSRTFTLFGLQTQIFEGTVLQVTDGGQVTVVSLLDTNWMPYTQILGNAIPPYDPSLTATAPTGATGSYVDDMVAYLRANLPDEMGGFQTNFFKVFNETVQPYDASITDPLQQSARTLANLDVWGIPTSRPFRDPAHANQILIRMERGVLRFDANCRCTTAIPLGTYFRALLTGVDLPSDIEQQSPNSPFLRQYDASTEKGPYRPGELANTDLTWAFVPSLQGPPPAPPAPVAAEPTVPPIAPTSTPVVRPDPTATAVPPTPKPFPTPNPINSPPWAIIIQAQETGRQTILESSKSGEDERSIWQTVRYVRDRDRETSGIGPNVIYNKVYVARNQQIAREIFAAESAVKNFPEAIDRYEGFFIPDKPNLGVESSAIGSCEGGCNADRYNVHLRLVYRRGNVVSVFYTFGDQLSSSMNIVYYLAKNVADRMAW